MRQYGFLLIYALILINIGSFFNDSDHKAISFIIVTVSSFLGIIIGVLLTFFTLNNQHIGKTYIYTLVFSQVFLFVIVVPGMEKNELLSFLSQILIFQILWAYQKQFAFLKGQQRWWFLFFTQILMAFIHNIMMNTQKSQKAFSCILALIIMLPKHKYSLFSNICLKKHLFLITANDGTKFSTPMKQYLKQFQIKENKKDEQQIQSQVSNQIPNILNRKKSLSQQLSLVHQFQSSGSMPLKQSSRLQSFHSKVDINGEESISEKNDSCSDYEWKQMQLWIFDEIKIGIIEISQKTNDIVFSSTYVKEYFKQFLEIEQSDIHNLIMNVFKYKIIHSQKKKRHSRSEDDLKQRFKLTNSISLKTSKNPAQTSRSSIICPEQQQKQGFKEDLFADKEFLLAEIIQLYRISYLEPYKEPNQRYLELQSVYTDLDRDLQLTISFKLMDNFDIQDPDENLSIVFEDISRQNELIQFKTKQTFANNMINSLSHELRTPLNGAQNYLKTAEHDNIIDTDILELYIKPALNALKMQEYLIQDIIDFQSTSDQNFTLQASTFTIGQLTNDLIMLFDQPCKMKRLNFIIELKCFAETDITTDYQRSLQVLVNIINNSIKFSYRGRITVVVDYTYQELVFSIIDQGIGMDKQKEKNLNSFIENYPIKGISQQDWHGLGLVMSVMLLNHLNPNRDVPMEIASEGINCGSKVTFYIENLSKQIQTASKLEIRKIERKQIQSQSGVHSKKRQTYFYHDQNYQKQHEESCDVELEENMINSASNQIGLLSIQQPFGSKEQLTFKASLKQNLTQGCQCRTILSVDDEIFNQNSIKLLLNRIKYDVVTAFNGLEAVNLFKNQQYQKCSYDDCKGFLLILMDVSMPIMNGWDCTVKLTQMMDNMEIPRIPIVGLTAFTQYSDIKKCIQSGMCKVLHKPLNIKLLQEILLEIQCQSKTHENKH